MSGTDAPEKVAHEPIPEPLEEVIDDAKLNRDKNSWWAKSETGKSWKKTEILKRRLQIVKLMPYRLTQEDMAKQLGIKALTVTMDIKAIRKIWQERFLVRYDTYRAEELAILDNDERHWRIQLQLALQGKKRQVMKPDGTEVEEWETVPDRDLALSIQDRIMAIMRMKMELSGLRGGQPGPTPRESQSGPALSDAELAHRLLAAFQMGRITKEQQDESHLLTESQTIIDVTPVSIDEREPVMAESVLPVDTDNDTGDDELDA